MYGEIDDVNFKAIKRTLKQCRATNVQNAQRNAKHAPVVATNRMVTWIKSKKPMKVLPLMSVISISKQLTRIALLLV